MKTIRRYSNRKLYDTEESRYITLDEIGAFLRSGGEVQVLDSRTGEDITAVTLAQVLLGEEKKSRPAVPIQRVIGLIQSGGEYIQRKLATEYSSLRDEAEKTVARLKRGESDLREFVEATHRAYDDFQRQVDERLQVMVAALRKLSPIQQELDRLKEEVKELRQRVEALETRHDKE